MNADTQLAPGATVPFGKKDRIGYMFGDMGNDFTYAMMSSFLMLFLTDIFGLSGLAAGLVLMVARFWDAFADVAFGIFLDARKPGPGGKFRPWLIWSALPVTVLGLLTFTAIPGLSETQRLVWAYVTYIAWGTAYSSINIPYGSLASVITSDPGERASLASYRAAGGLVAYTTVTVVAPLLIFSKEGQPTAMGFFASMLIFCVLALVSYWIAWRNAVERIPAEKDPHLDLSVSLRGLIHNRPLIGLLITSFAVLVISVVISSLNAYLFKDWFHNPKLISLGGAIMLVSLMIVIPLMEPLARRYGKKEISLAGLLLALCVYVVLYLVPIKDPYVFIGIQFIATLGFGALNVMIWALAADVIDYQEFLTHKREEGVVYSVFSFTRKMGQGAAGGFGGLVLTSIGYASGQAVQTDAVAAGVRDAITLIPLLCLVVAIVGLHFIYNLSKTNLEAMNVALAQHRSKTAHH